MARPGVGMEGETGRQAYVPAESHYSIHAGTTGQLSGRLTPTFRDLGGA